MAQTQVVAKGARITGAVLCLLFAFQGIGWLFYDLEGIGLKDLWGLWTLTDASGAQRDHAPATSPVSFALTILQVTAGIVALRGVAMSGGLLMATAGLTAAYRLPAVWAGFIHTDGKVNEPFFRFVGFQDEAFFSGINALTNTVLAGVVMLVMLSARRPPMQPRPLHPNFPGTSSAPPATPMRPAPAAALVTAGFLAVLAVFQVGWHIRLWVESDDGPGPSASKTWQYAMTGEYSLAYLFGVPPGWQWMVMAVACGVGALLAVLRGLASRGWAVAVSVAVLPEAFFRLWGYIDNDILFELGEEAEKTQFFQRLEVILTVLGAILVIVLMSRRGQPVGPDGPGAPFAGGPAGGPYPAWQPGVPPQPAGGYGYPSPPQPPPGGGYGFPPQPPPGPPPGGYGTPQ